MSLLAPAFLLGLLGGLHCAGMCGPLLLALPAAGQARTRFLAGRLVYHTGRMLTYCLLGLLFGLAGRSLLLAGLQQWVSVTLGLALLAGLVFSPRLLEFAWISRWVSHLRSMMAGFLRTRTLASMAILGGLNGLLPCGLVYAACAGAAATASAAHGALFMLAFGVGTLPITLAIALSGHLLPTSVRLRLRYLMPLSVGVLGCLLVLRGLSLGIPYLSPDLTSGAGSCCHGPTPTP